MGKRLLDSSQLDTLKKVINKEITAIYGGQAKVDVVEGGVYTGPFVILKFSDYDFLQMTLNFDCYEGYSDQNFISEIKLIDHMDFVSARTSVCLNVWNNFKLKAITTYLKKVQVEEGEEEITTEGTILFESSVGGRFLFDSSKEILQFHMLWWYRNADHTMPKLEMKLMNTIS
jgi:hypothetical protein